MPGLVQKYVRTGKVRMEFHALAFIGPDSVRAARVAEAAGRQNKLWNVADLAYHNQGKENSGWATDAKLRSIAAAVPGLDVNQVFAARNSAAVTAQLKAASDLATRSGVQRDADVPRRPRLEPQGRRRRRPARRDQGGRRVMTDRLRTVAIAISVVGIAIAGYLTYVHYAGISPVCEIAHGCEKVQTSEWSKVAGIPVAVLGLLGYVGILAALLIPGETAATAAAGMALVGVGFSAYLTYREVFTIEAICIWCVASALLMAALAVVTVLRLARQAPPRAGQRRARRPVAAHAVDAAARRRRRGAEVDARNRRRVRHAPGDRAREQLAEVLRPAVDVAADVVRVAPLDLARCPSPSGPRSAA